jgi:hypothetical protein
MNSHHERLMESRLSRLLGVFKRLRRRQSATETVVDDLVGRLEELERAIEAARETMGPWTDVHTPPDLERYRKARADLAELDLELRRREMLRRVDLADARLKQGVCTAEEAREMLGEYDAAKEQEPVVRMPDGSKITRRVCVSKTEWPSWWMDATELARLVEIDFYGNKAGKNRDADEELIANEWLERGSGSGAPKLAYTGRKILHNAYRLGVFIGDSRFRTPSTNQIRSGEYRLTPWPEAPTETGATEVKEQPPPPLRAADTEATPEPPPSNTTRITVDGYSIVVRLSDQPTSRWRWEIDGGNCFSASGDAWTLLEAVHHTIGLAMAGQLRRDAIELARNSAAVGSGGVA